MRALLTLVLVAVMPMVAAAQLPRNLGGIARQLPSLDGLLRARPLTTDFDDTARQQPVLDRKESRRQARPLRSLPRTARGGFILQPGLWEGTFQSYCLRTATYAPGKGDGYLYAPVKGSRATAIQTILAASSVVMGSQRRRRGSLGGRSDARDLRPVTGRVVHRPPMR